MTFQLKAWKKHITSGYCTLCPKSWPSFLHATWTSLLKSLLARQKAFVTPLKVVSHQVASKQAFHSETGLYLNHHIAAQMNWESACYTCYGRYKQWQALVYPLVHQSNSSDMGFSSHMAKFLLAHLPLVAKKMTSVPSLCVHPIFPCDFWWQAAFSPHLNPKFKKLTTKVFNKLLQLK